MSLGPLAAPAAADTGGGQPGGGQPGGGQHCDWDTTITGHVSATRSATWMEAVAADREEVLTAGRWTPDMLFGELGHEFTIPDPTGFHARPLEDLGTMSEGHEAGWRRHPVLGYRKFHSGFDFGGSSGDPLWALTDGTVVQATYRSSYGNLLVIDHGLGFVTVYAHLSAFAVGVGDVVEAGQVVGSVGSTGRVTGSHLHFETRLGGVPVNPRFFVNDIASPGGVLINEAYDELDTIPDASAASVYRLYSAYFLRCPDPGGFAFWVNHRAAGHDLVAVSDAFALSEEFTSTYGESFSDSAFLDLVYRHVLGRAPETEGKAYWLEQMADGMTRGTVMLQFSDSDEYRALTGF